MPESCTLKTYPLRPHIKMVFPISRNQCLALRSTPPCHAILTRYSFHNMFEIDDESVPSAFTEVLHVCDSWPQTMTTTNTHTKISKGGDRDSEEVSAAHTKWPSQKTYSKADPRNGQQYEGRGAVTCRCSWKVPAVAANDAPLKIKLQRLFSNVSQPLGCNIAILVHVEIQIEISLHCQPKQPLRSGTFNSVNGSRKSAAVWVDRQHAHQCAGQCQHRFLASCRLCVAAVPISRISRPMMCSHRACDHGCQVWPRVK